MGIGLSGLYAAFGDKRHLFNEAVKRFGARGQRAVARRAAVATDLAVAAWVHNT